MAFGSKILFNVNSMFNAKTDETLIHIGKVISNTDPYDGGTIKVRINNVDPESIRNEDLPNCFPLLPKHLNVIPKVGEYVFIIKSTLKNQRQHRLWMGPIISQPQKLGKDDNLISATSTKDGAALFAEKAPSTDPKIRGVYPNKEHISIQGRDNNDIVLLNNEIQIRNGKYTPSQNMSINNLAFNAKSISYIKIKNDITIGSKIENGRETEVKGGATTIVSDKINLITHSGYKRFNVTNQDNLITDKELLNIMEKASPMVYGDKLKDFLEELKEFINNHTHPYDNLPPYKTPTVLNLLNFNLNDLLSKNIKIS